MSEEMNFEADFEDVEEGTLDAAEAAEETAAAPATSTDDASAVADDDFFAEEAAAEVPQVDPNTVVTVQTTSADPKYVIVEQPTPMVDLVHLAGLQFAGDFTCFLNGAQIDLSTKVPGGSTVVIAGKVKGG